ncbi:hypothetical protein K9L97_02215 [Candidatus Woesearchaeota archaeon]|nr:hypothetical protein [Candidatus Woesearchaeota archaeon]
MKPKKFLRKDTHKKTKVGMKWRKPKGLQNKKRLHVKGHAATVKPGYGTEKTKKNTNKQGLLIVSVNKIEELKTINPKTQTITIPNLGRKNKTQIIEEAKKLNITIQNLNLKKYEENTKQKQKQKQETAKQREQKLKEKQKQDKENKKNTESKTQTTENKTEEDKKKQQKEEQDKILTKAK